MLVGGSEHGTTGSRPRPHAMIALLMQETQLPAQLDITMLDFSVYGYFGSYTNTDRDMRSRHWII